MFALLSGRGGTNVTARRRETGSNAERWAETCTWAGLQGPSLAKRRLPRFFLPRSVAKLLALNSHRKYASDSPILSLLSSHTSSPRFKLSRPGNRHLLLAVGVRPPHQATAFSPVKTTTVRTYPTTSTSIQISAQAPLKPSRIHEAQ